MKERVYILATCRKPDLLPGTLLVFRTLLTGFPTAQVTVQSNGLTGEPFKAVAELSRDIGARFETGTAPTQHDRWLTRLIETQHQPFWVVDTDVVFLESMEDCLPAYLAGEYQPAFVEEYTRTTHVERLHTAVMHIDPVQVRDRVRSFQARYPAPEPFEVTRVLVQQTYVPRNDEVLFYDTAAGLYHAIGGVRLPDWVTNRFEHLQCATYVDRIGPHLKDAPGLQIMHAQVYADPKSARGLRARQAEYYRRRMPTFAPPSTSHL